MTEKKDTLEEILDNFYELIHDDYHGNNENHVRELIREIVARSQMDTSFVSRILETK